MQERDHYEYKGLGGWIICIFEQEERGVMDWINLAWDRDWWMADVNMVMNLQVP
jgi:hypothetical protein